METAYLKALKKFNSHDFEGALYDFSTLLNKNPENYKAIIAKARCQLALSHTDAASFTYASILNYPKSDLTAKAEALLFAKQFQGAQTFLADALKKYPHDGEIHFLFAVSYYKFGNITKTLSSIGASIINNFVWEDEDPVDFILSYVLENNEYYDFEQIYLDIFEAQVEGKENPQNRWFSINIPVYELFSASSKNQPKKAQNIAHLLGEEHISPQLENGKTELENILRDFARHQQDARFGLEALKNLAEEKYSQVASLILAMQLEHLKSFANYFGLEVDTINDSQLQSLIPLLPYRIAILLMFLYAASEPKDPIQEMALQNLDTAILVNMIAICFSAFYKEINQYKLDQPNQIF